MNWDAISAVGEIVGAAAVLLTLLYLAKQINQTNKIAQFNSTHQVLTLFNETNRLIVSDADTRRVLLQKEALTDEDREHLYSFVDILCNTYAMVESAYQAGLVDESTYRSAARDLGVSMSRWPNARVQFELWLARYPAARGLHIFQLAAANSQAE